MIVLTTSPIDSMVWHGRIYSSLPFLRTAAERRVNTGVWGTAAFPSVYSTQTRQWQYLPHTPAWMAGTVALLLIGNIGPLAGMDAAWLPLVAGILALLTTLIRCARFARGSDLSGVPRLGHWPLTPSRWVYRAVITWLRLENAPSLNQNRSFSQCFEGSPFYSSPASCC